MYRKRAKSFSPAKFHPRLVRGDTSSIPDHSVWAPANQIRRVAASAKTPSHCAPCRSH
ncbi:hypothetical protein Mapa_013126 [Marchantia paleacea]|nr:hypothetical protein Mapa_013126 [Marchantia paleacea]